MAIVLVMELPRCGCRISKSCLPCLCVQVREGRPLPAMHRDMLLASSLVDTPMPQAAAEMPGAAAAVIAAAAAAPGMGMMVDANLGSASAMQGVQVVQPLNGAAMTSSQVTQPAGSVGGPPAATVSGQQLQQQGPGVMRSMDSFSSAVNDPAGSRAAAAAAASMGAGVSVGAAPQPAMQHTMQLHSGMAAGAGSGALFGSVTSLQGMTGREGSLDGSGLGTLVAPAPPSAPIAVPTRSHGVPDAAMMAAAAASSLGTSPGMGPSPALTKSGMDDAAAVAAAAAAQQQQAAAAAAAAAAAVAVPVPGVVPAAVPGMPAMSMGLPTAIVASSQPLAASQALSSGGAGGGLPAVVSDAAAVGWWCPVLVWKPCTS
jgi:hypothetical protein